MNLLNIENLQKTYINKNRKVEAIKNLTVQFPDTGLIVLNGKSGSGKTTFMKMLTGLDKPSGGQINYRGNRIEQYDENDWISFRNNKIGIVFQNYQLLNEKTIRYNLQIVLELLDVPASDYEEMIAQTLSIVGLEGYEDYKCNQLSAGQKQRVAIARAIIKNPEILIADEATGNLDPDNTEQILQLFSKISTKCLVILISHNKYAIEKYADRIITFSEGEVVRDIDNSDRKRFYSNQYALSVDAGRWEGGISEFNVCDYICDCKDRNNGSKGDISFEIKVNQVTKEIEPQNFSYDSFSIKKTTPASALRHLSFYRTEYSRFAAMMIITIFVMIMVMTVHMIYQNDYLKSISDYFATTGVQRFSIIKHEEGKQISKGKLYENEVFLAVDEKYVYKSYMDEVSCEEISETAMILYNDTNTLDIELFSGEGIRGDNEIVVSTAVMNDLGIELGDIVTLWDKNCVVVGSFLDREPCCFVSKSVGQRKPDSITACAFPGVDITVSSDKKVFGESWASLGVASEITEDSLLYGNMPTQKNEVLLSKTKAELDFDWPQGTIMENSRIFDLYSEEDGLTYSENLNMYDFMGRNAHIVGVYDDSMFEDHKGDIIVLDEVFTSVLDDYFEHFSYEKLQIMCKDEDSLSLLRNLDHRNILVNEERVEAMTELKAMSEKSHTGFFIAIVLLNAFLFAICLLVFTYSILDKKNRIGILKGIGVSKTEIQLQIFSMNVGKMLVTIGCAWLIAIQLLNLVNRFVAERYDDKQLIVYKMNSSLFLPYVGVCVVVILIMIWLPTHRLLNRKTMLLLDEE